MRILGLDGDESMVFLAGGRNRRKSGYTAMMSEILEMCGKCHFDKATSRWLHFQDPAEDFAIRRSTEDIVQYIASPIVRAFAGRRWESAALSRWSGTIRCLKRLVVGSAFNNILPLALAGLAPGMNMNQRKVDQMLQQMQQGRSKDETSDNKWVMHAQRVVKVSAYFQDGRRRWQCAVVLIGTSVIDRLHWRILGANGKKLDLTGFADPFVSEVGVAMQEFTFLAEVWGAGATRWSLLEWLGVSAYEDDTLMHFSLGVVSSLSAGVFWAAERRYSSWPYRLQILLSQQATEAQKQRVLREFGSARGCCLGSCGRRLRALFDTEESRQGPQLKKAVELLQDMARFSTSPVENDHKIVKDDACSTSVGAATAPICHRAILRHLQSAHRQLGSPNTALPLRREAAQRPQTGSVLCNYLALEDAWPQAQQQQAPLLDDIHGADLGSIGGGSPKVCFLDYRMSSAKASHGGKMSKDIAQQVRAVAVHEFDSQPELRLRSQHIFAAIQARRRLDKGAQQLVPVPEAGAQAECDGKRQVWGSVPQDDQVCDGPVGEGVLAEVKKIIAPTVKEMERIAGDGELFRAEVTKVPPADASRIWGCACNPMHMCRQGLAAQGLLSRFEGLRAAINGHIDQVPKEKVHTASHLVLFRCQSAQGDLATWCHLCKAFYSPKVSIHIRCAPAGCVMDGAGFAKVEVQAPYKVNLLSCPSRLCCPDADPPPFTTLWHETSEEIAARLARAGGECTATVCR